MSLPRLGRAALVAALSVGMLAGFPVTSAAAGPGNCGSGVVGAPSAPPTGANVTPDYSNSQNASVLLTWDQNSPAGATSYDAGYNDANDVPVSGNQVDFQGLTYGTQYVFFVCARNSLGTGPAATVTLTPRYAQINVSPVIVNAGNQITVSGTGFQTGQAVAIYLDATSDVLGSSPPADASGNFSANVTIPDSTNPGSHCILAPPAPKACGLTIEPKATPTPSPSPSPSPTPTPTPTPTPSPSPTPTPVGGVPDIPSGIGGGLTSLSPVAFLFRPPLVIFPILLLLGLAGWGAYITYSRLRPAPALPPQAIVTHRSIRPPGPPPTYIPPGMKPPADDEPNSEE